jgi:Na+/proline symporter
MKQVTHPQILEDRYSLTSGVTATVYYITQSISGIGAQLLAMGSLITLVTGWPVLLSAAISAVIILVWVLLGGMLGTSWGDLLHWVIFIVGLAVLVPLTISQAGGLHKMFATPGLPAGFGDVWHIAPSDALAGTLLIAPTALALQTYFQRLLGAKSARAGQVGVLSAAALMIPVYIFVPLLGIAGRYLFPHISAASVFPQLMINEFPTPVGVLLYAAITSALMSSAGGTALSAASNLTQDVYVRLIRPQATEQRQALVARLSVVGLIVLSFLLLWAIPSILPLLLFGFYGVVGGVLIPWLAALYWPRVTTKAANASMIIGGAVSIALYFYDQVAGHPLLGVQPIFVGLVLAIVITVGGSLLDKPEREKHEEFLRANGIGRKNRPAEVA